MNQATLQWLDNFIQQDFHNKLGQTRLLRQAVALVIKLIRLQKLYKSLWNSMNLCESLWIFMNLYETLWNSMNFLWIYESPMNLNEFQKFPCVFVN